MRRWCGTAVRHLREGLSAILLMLVCASSSGSETITIAVRESFSLSSGYMEILTEAYRRIGQPVTFANLPGASSLRYSNTGELGIDGEAGRLSSVLENYPNIRKVDLPIFYSELTAFVARENLAIAKWEDMVGLEVTTRLGYKLVLDRLKSKNINVQSVGSSEAAIKLVSKNRADVAILTREDGIAAINKLGAKGVKMLSPPVEMLPVYHMLNKKHQLLIEKLQQALQEMKRDGYIDRVWERQLRGLRLDVSTASDESVGPVKIKP